VEAFDLTSRPPAQLDLRWIASSASLAFLWTTFALANVEASLTSHHLVGLGATLTELIVAYLYVMRRPAVAVDHRRLAWVAAGIGSFGLLATRPSFRPLGGSRMDVLYVGLQIAGSVVAAGCLIVLGRSFGIVPANRGIITRGPYGIVRHPVYAGFLVAMVGYALQSPSARNFLIVAIVAVFQLVRIRYEESCLADDQAYQAYRRRVRYRLVPFLY